MLIFLCATRIIPEDWEFHGKELQTSRTSTAVLQIAPLVLGICVFAMIAIFFFNSNRGGIKATSNMFKDFSSWGTCKISSLL